MSDNGKTVNGDDADVVQLARRSVRKGQPDPQVNTEMGVSANLPIGSWGSWLGGTGVASMSGDGKTILNVGDALSIDQLNEMLKKDGQARALLRLMIAPLLSTLVESEWIAPEGADGKAEKEVEFANNMFKLPPELGGMRTPLTKVMRQTVRAIGLGFSAFEEVRYVPDVGPLAGQIVLEELAYRDPRTVKFRVDDKGRFDGIRQVASVMGQSVDVEIPKDKVWYWAANEEENPFYGQSYFDTAHFHYDIKKKLYYISHIAAQFAAVPGRVGKTPSNPNPKELAAFKRALADFAFNTAMTHPDGYEVLPFNGNTGFDFLKLIDHHNTMMAASVLAKFMQQEDRQVLIDNGKADASADMFVLVLEGILHDIAESWTHLLMPKYIDWNFDSQMYPVFRFGALADSAKDAIKEIFENIVGLGQLNATPEFAREIEKKLATRLGLDIDYDEIERMEKEQADAQAQADQQAAQDQADAMADPTNPMFGQPPGGPPGAGGPPGGNRPPGAGGPPAGGNPFGGGQVAASETGGGFITLTDVVNELARREEEDVD